MTAISDAAGDEFDVVATYRRTAAMRLAGAGERMRVIELARQGLSPRKIAVTLDIAQP